MSKQKMKRVTRFLIAPLLLSLSFLLIVPTQSFAASDPSQGKQAITISATGDISGLGASKKDIKADLQGTTYQTETVTFQVDPASCFVAAAPEGYDYLGIGNLKPSTKPGEPQLPMQTFIVELDKDAQVYGVEVTGGKFIKAKQAVNIVPMPQPTTWNADDKEGKYIPDAKVYNLNGLFPGKLVSYDIGQDTQKQYVYVRVYPVQYLPNKKQVFILTDATIDVYYGAPDVSARGKPQPPEPPPEPQAGNITPTDAVSIIICPGALETAANALKSLHISEGVSAEIVTTETIAANVGPAEDPPFRGYKDSGLTGWRNIKNYDYTLAKQIIAYLRDAVAHPNLVYVTIIGDGLLVPPSYFYSYYASGSNDIYYWIPTDFFYTSPGYDFTPDFKIGRISVNDATEATAYINKRAAWASVADWSWFKKAYFAGSKAHLNDYYCGELNTANSINEGYFTGSDINKCYRSDGSFTKACLEPSLSTADAGMAYIISHGGPISILLESPTGGEDQLWTDDLMGYAPNTEVPVVFSVICYGGDYDRDLKKGGTSTSMGEATIKSAAGGIAYIGGSRNNKGDSLYHFEQGNVVIDKLTYVVDYLNYAFQNYHEGKNRLGDMVDGALNYYVVNNDMIGDEENTAQLFRNVLFGDPVLNVPAQQAATEYTKAACTALNPASYDAQDIPVYSGAPVTISASTNSPTVEWKLIDLNTNTTIDNNVTDYPPFEYTSQVGTEALYLVRASTEAGVPSTNYAKENWLFYSIGGGSQQQVVMHVASIDMSLHSQGPNTNAVATVTIVDATDAPVSGATVSGHWSGLTSDTDSGITGGNGQVDLSSDKLRNPSGTFTFCVDDVTISGGTYDSGANVETCDSITAP